MLGDENAWPSRGWASAEPDSASYRVWRAERAEALVDVRRLAASGVLPATGRPGDGTGATRGSPGLRDWYYRVAAVDAAGNVSAPTAAGGHGVDTRPPNRPLDRRGVDRRRGRRRL